jgi:hypothetical protein
MPHRVLRCAFRYEFFIVIVINKEEDFRKSGKNQKARTIVHVYEIEKIFTFGSRLVAKIPIRKNERLNSSIFFK